MTIKLGVPTSNVFIPYTATTKRTKELALVKTTDITATSSAALGTYTVNRCVAIFYADSAGVWRARVNCEIGNCTASARTICDIDFVNLVFKSGYQQAVTLKVSDGSFNYSGGAFTVSGATTVRINHTSISSTTYTISFDVELNAEPTTYTTASNMEGVLPVNVFIPNASATESGLITTGAQTIAGVKTFSSGIQLPTTGGTAATLSNYEEHSYTATWDVSGSTTTSTITIRAIGKLVSVSIGQVNHVLAGGASAFSLQAGSALPSRFRSATRTYFLFAGRDGGADIETVCQGFLEATTGVIYLYKGMGQTFSNGSSAGTRVAGNNSMFSYFV